LRSYVFDNMDLVIAAPAAVLPEGWQSQDIGTTGGSAAESDGTWAISADGADIWGSADEFHYAYVPLSGDGTIIAQVISNGEGSNGWAKGGVMIRETLDQGSKHAIMALTGGEGGGMAFQCRPETDSSDCKSSHDLVPAAPPYWVKLTRVGNTFTGYSSADGVEWLQQPTRVNGDGTPVPVDIEMAADVYIGLFATSHAAGEIRTYTFDNVSVVEPAGNIIWVSFHGADDAPSGPAADVGFTEASDKGYTDLLKANGYNVTRYITSSTPDPEVLNAADLVIISRAVSSGGYSNDGATAWNNISAPMIIMGGYVLRSSRMGYTTGTNMPDTTGDVKLTVSDPTHPIFAGIPLTDGTMDNSYAGGAVVLPTDGTTVSRGISINNDPADDEGTILATIAEASADTGPVGGMVIAEWPAGATLTHAGGAETDVLAGHRLVFLTGSREPDGVTGGDAAGLYDLYPDGEKMLLNAVDYMIPVKLVDVTAPGDAIQGVPNDGDWPGAETPDLAVDDNTATKYLHFKGETETTGFQVTPTAGPSIVTGLTLTTANDAIERDPIAFELSGSNEGIDGPYELIASGDVVDFAQADAWPRFTMNATPILFDNDVAYAHYQVLFPAVRDPGSANSMQIAEVELLGVPGPAGPIVHYKLDDGEGVIAVDSANGLDGILMGDPQWSAGVLDGALDFDGDGDYVDCGTNATLNSLNEAITASAWINIRSVTTAWMTVMAKGENAWRIAVNNLTTGMHFGFSGGDRGWQAANSASELTLNEWHHVAATYDLENGGRIYIDGVEDGNNPDLGGVQMNEMPFLIGENPEALGRFFDGLIDDVRIYDRALSADEVSELTALGAPANILANGGFEDGVADPWSTYGDATLEVVQELVGAAVPDVPIEGSSCLHVVVGSAGANFWDAGLQHAGHVFEAGKQYTLSAFLKCSQGTLDINFKPELAEDPWSGYGEQSFTMTDQWAEYSVTTPVFDADVSPGCITFHIAYAAADFWIDDVRFVEVE